MPEQNEWKEQNEQTISLCMIVRNEADHLPRCLDRVHGLVDEIIIVDTGSTDETAAIARSFGAKVSPFTWINDFAAARNFGLEQASGDWILFLDADEYMDEADQVKLRPYLKQYGNHDGFFFKMYSYMASESHSAAVNPVLRMFRNRPEHRFEGAIHEQIASVILRHQPGASFVRTDIKIHHYGYRPDMIANKDKHYRNLAILQDMLAVRPQDPFALYNLAAVYLSKGDVDTALNMYRESRSYLNPAASGFAHLVFEHEINCLRRLGRFEEALHTCDEASDFYPDYTDLHHMKGHILISMGRLEEAEATLLHALRLGPPPMIYNTEDGIGTYQTGYLLGLVYEAQAEFNKAMNHYLWAYRSNSGYTPALRRMLRLTAGLGADSIIPGLVEEKLRPSTARQAMDLISALLDEMQTGPVYKLAALVNDDGLRLEKDEALLVCCLLDGNYSQARLTAADSPNRGLQVYLPLIEWLERGHELGLPDDIPFDQALVPLAVKTAFRNGHWKASLDLIGRRQSVVHTVDTCCHSVRTLAALADRRLAAFTRSSPASGLQELVRDIRRSLPYHDGF